MNLQESATPFARFVEPTELAFEIAASIEDALLKPRLHGLTVSAWAAIVQQVIAPYERKYVSMENALGAACQTALIHGAGDEEMRVISDLVENSP
jgi:hypothetical protein